MTWRWAAWSLGVGAAVALAACGSDDAPAPPANPPKTPPAEVADPGRVTIHRLNRAEYNNTVRDLLATNLRPADDFPYDDISFGFDNISSVMTTSPLQVELYERAATTLAEDALNIPFLTQTWFFEAETLMGTTGKAAGDAYNLWSNGSLGTAITFPITGRYRLSVRLWGQQGGPDVVKAALLLNQATVANFEVPNTESDPLIFNHEMDIDAGTHEYAVAFLNDFFDPDNNIDRNMWVDWIRVEGPLDAVAENPLRDAIVSCDIEDDSCVRDISRELARRAWRRPVDDAELDRLLKLFQLVKAEGDDANTGLEIVLRAILLSPHFLFRPELDSDPTSQEAHPLGDYELAARMSYFMWSSMPDEALFAAAASGELRNDEGLRKQVNRMLADDKARALIDNFGGQWLYTRALADHEPDYEVFPDWDEPLRDAMAQETQRFFDSLLRGEHGMGVLLTADFSFLNARLASHYGETFDMAKADADGFAKTSLKKNAKRRGILGHGSLLTVTSYATRTSPVKRGKWVLEQLLCTPPSPPPAGVEGLIEEEEPTGSLREQLEKHRQDPVCASCHDTMDPIGLALEHFDGTGAWRDDDSGFDIDASGVYALETPFDGASELSTLIADDPRFAGCLSHKLFTYALGRGIEGHDTPHLAHIAKAFKLSSHKLPELIALIVTSDPFRMRRGEPISNSGGMP
jgi:hypothetical protein